MLPLNSKLIKASEGETTITTDSTSFSVYTTYRKTAQMLEREFPDYYELAPDGASAIVDCVPIKLITKLRLSKLK